MLRRFFKDPDLEYDMTRAYHLEADDPEESQKNPAQSRTGHGREDGAYGKSQIRQRVTRGHTPRPDSPVGLTVYFLDAIPNPSWGRLERQNFKALLSVFRELLREGVSPDTCRAMVDAYVASLAGRTPTTAYCWDFKGRQYRLLRQVDATGADRTAEDYAVPVAQDPDLLTRREFLSSFRGFV